MPSRRQPATPARAAGDCRDPQYCFSVFGTPAAKGTWGWRVNGHHLSLHFNVANGSGVAGVADVLRIQPRGSARRAEEGTARFSATEEDTARALLMALDAGQRTTAIVRRRRAGRHRDEEQAVKVDPLSPDRAGRRRR